ncbi:hypothetical protein JOC24_006639 [Streptomyces sp. HB132]|nr:hypothetical protein [Streptomyces sp. HB132]
MHSLRFARAASRPPPRQPRATAIPASRRPRRRRSAAVRRRHRACRWRDRHRTFAGSAGAGIPTRSKCRPGLTAGGPRHLECLPWARSAGLDPLVRADIDDRGRAVRPEREVVRSVPTSRTPSCRCSRPGGARRSPPPAGRSPGAEAGIRSRRVPSGRRPAPPGEVTFTTTPPEGPYGRRVSRAVTLQRSMPLTLTYGIHVRQPDVRSRDSRLGRYGHRPAGVFGPVGLGSPGRKAGRPGPLSGHRHRMGADTGARA